MTTPTEAPREALPEPLKVVAYLRATKDGTPIWEGDDCVCEDPVYPSDPDGSDADSVSMPLVRLTDAQSALESERQAHAAEVERLRADAERYRWLRDKSEWEPFDSRWLIEVDIYGTPSSEMDAAIDQAIARGKT